MVPKKSPPTSPSLSPLPVLLPTTSNESSITVLNDSHASTKSHRCQAPPIFSSLVQTDTNSNFNFNNNDTNFFDSRIAPQKKVPLNLDFFSVSNTLSNCKLLSDKFIKRKKKQTKNNYEINTNNTDNDSNDDNVDVALKKTKLRKIESQIAVNESQIKVNNSFTMLNQAKLRVIYDKFFVEKSINSIDDNFNNDSQINIHNFKKIN